MALSVVVYVTKACEEMPSFVSLTKVTMQKKKCRLDSVPFFFFFVHLHLVQYTHKYEGRLQQVPQMTFMVTGKMGWCNTIVKIHLKGKKTDGVLRKQSDMK